MDLWRNLNLESLFKSKTQDKIQKGIDPEEEAEEAGCDRTLLWLSFAFDLPEIRSDGKVLSAWRLERQAGDGGWWFNLLEQQDNYGWRTHKKKTQATYLLIIQMLAF